jgi:hypothetical protein
MTLIKSELYQSNFLFIMTLPVKSTEVAYAAKESSDSSRAQGGSWRYVTRS